MEKNKEQTHLDAYIREMVQAVETREPELPDLEAVTRERRQYHWTYFLRVAAASLIVLLGTLFVHNHVRSGDPGSNPTRDVSKRIPAKELSEIRTDFVLREDNIKIIWIQKKNFKLNNRRKQT